MELSVIEQLTHAHRFYVWIYKNQNVKSKTQVINDFMFLVDKNEIFISTFLQNISKSTVKFIYLVKLSELCW